MATYINVTAGPSGLLQRDQENREAQRFSELNKKEDKADAEKKEQQGEEEQEQGRALPVVALGKKLTASRLNKGGMLELGGTGRQEVPGTFESVSEDWTGYRTSIRELQDPVNPKKIWLGISVLPYAGRNSYMKADVFWQPVMHANGKPVSLPRYTVPNVYLKLNWTSRQQSHISATFDASSLFPGLSVPPMQQANTRAFPYSLAEVRGAHGTMLYRADLSIDIDPPAVKQRYQTAGSASWIQDGKVYHWGMLTELTPANNFLVSGGFDESGYMSNVKPYIALDSDYRMALRHKRVFNSNDPDYYIPPEGPDYTDTFLPIFGARPSNGRQFIKAYADEQVITWSRIRWEYDLKTGAVAYDKTELWRLVVTLAMSEKEVEDSVALKGEFAFDDFWRDMPAGSPYKELFHYHMAGGTFGAGGTVRTAAGFSRNGTINSTSYGWWPRTLNYDKATGKAAITCRQSTGSSTWVRLDRQFAPGLTAVDIRRLLPTQPSVMLPYLFPSEYTEGVLVANGWSSKGPLKTRPATEQVFVSTD